METEPPYELNRFKARLFWLGREPFKPGKTYKIKLATQEAEVVIESIENTRSRIRIWKIAAPKPSVAARVPPSARID